jgi:hypothetical protein
MPQTPIRLISAAAFVYPAANPQFQFFQRKTKYPYVAFDGGLCPIGGGWVGAEAIEDIGPRWTVGREIGEEMQPRHRSGETEPATEEERLFAYLKRCILLSLRPFGDFVHTVPSKYLGRVDMGKDSEPMTYLSSVFTAALSSAVWEALESLHSRVGNVLNEGASTILHADVVVEEDPIIWGHAFAFQELARRLDLPQADKLRTAPGISSRWIGMPRDTYAAYREDFAILKDPTNW